MKIEKIRTSIVLYSIILISVLIPTLAHSQTKWNDLLLGKSNDYIGQRADNKDKNGTGLQRLGSGGIYIGDFNCNKYTGRGMLIVGDGQIKNLPGTYVYIGSWLKGKKNGRGTCYAANGDIVYQGRFENDKPVETYPQPDADIITYFNLIEDQDGAYIGEVKNGEPNGFGIYIQPDGTYWVGNSKNGKRNGIGTFINGADSWEVVKYKDGGYTSINSSDIYNARRQRYAEVKSAQMSEFWHGMSEVATGLVSVGQQYVELKNSSSSSSIGTENTSVASGSSSSKSSKSSGAGSSSKSKNDCGTSWMSDSRVYSNYETQLIKGGQSLDERNDIRNKMRQIRQKWVQRGCTFTKSPHE